MNWDILLTLLGALGGLETIKWLSDRKNFRRLSKAQADSGQTEAAAARERLYEETILFLQTQLKEKEMRFAEQTAALRQSMQQELALTRNYNTLEIRYLTSRCDNFNCPHRQPPLPGLSANDILLFPSGKENLTNSEFSENNNKQVKFKEGVSK